MIPRQLHRFDDIVDALRVRFEVPPCMYTPVEVCRPVAEALGVGAEDVADVIDVLLADGSLRHSTYAGGGLLIGCPKWLRAAIRRNK
jgi:hypothetical protein